MSSGKQKEQFIDHRKPCDHCRARLAQDATRCQFCGRPQKKRIA